MITNALEHWMALSRASAYLEMDHLFTRNSLAEVWTEAAKIMQRYLMAAGCMVIYRPDVNDVLMTVTAAVGFDLRDLSLDYKVGHGQTGRCAATGMPIRWDDVSSHRTEFDTALLATLEKLHGQRIHSWLAVPISTTTGNYGVIKVVNTTSKAQWFTAADEQLAISLAIRLGVIVDKFASTDQLKVAQLESEHQREIAEQRAREATLAQQKAEDAARQRQDDLMVITHQLQGPLVSTIGAISALQVANLPSDVQARLESIRDLAEDSLNFCYGIYVTFANEAGNRSSFGVDEIDAPMELRKLTGRMRKTNARADLTFRFSSQAEFPRLYMDRNVFISVFYSLIHNAMKYADLHSQVTLECGFERGTEAALKVKSIGEPILPKESSTIFSKFSRGLTIQKSGRHHSGVGRGLWVARELMRAVGGDLTVELSLTHPRLAVFVVHPPKSAYERHNHDIDAFP